MHNLLDHLREKIDTYYNITGRFPEKITMPMDAIREIEKCYDCRYSVSLTYDYEPCRISGSFEGIPIYFVGRYFDYNYTFEGDAILEPRLEELNGRRWQWAEMLNSCILNLKMQIKEDVINDISEEELLTILEVKK